MGGFSGRGDRKGSAGGQLPDDGGDVGTGSRAGSLSGLSPQGGDRARGDPGPPWHPADAASTAISGRSRTPGCEVVIVAHAGTNAVVLGRLLGLEPVPWEWDRFPQPHTGVSRDHGSISTGWGFSLRQLGDVSHLDEDMISLDADRAAYLPKRRSLLVKSRRARRKSTRRNAGQFTSTKTNSA